MVAEAVRPNHPRPEDEQADHHGGGGLRSEEREKPNQRRKRNEVQNHSKGHKSELRSG